MISEPRRSVSSVSTSTPPVPPAKPCSDCPSLKEQLSDLSVRSEFFFQKKNQRYNSQAFKKSRYHSFIFSSIGSKRLRNREILFVAVNEISHICSEFSPFRMKLFRCLQVLKHSKVRFTGVN